MKVDTLGNVRNRFSEVVDHLGREPLFITRNGKVTAVLQAIRDEDVEDYLFRNSPRLQRLLDQRRAEAQKGGVIPFEPASYVAEGRARPMVLRDGGGRRRRRGR